MLNALLVWLKFWLILPGCAVLFPRYPIRHLIVTSIGRGQVPERGLHRIRWLYEQSKHRPVAFINDLRHGLHESPSIDPGYLNKELANRAMRLYESAGGTVTLWVQWEIALAMSERQLFDHWDQIRIIWPSDYEGASLNEADVLRYVYGHLPHLADDLPRVGILAHQSVIVRTMLIWQKLSGSLPIIPPQNICGYQPMAIQPEVRSAWAHFTYEVRTRIYHASHGLV